MDSLIAKIESLRAAESIYYDIFVIAVATVLWLIILWAWRMTGSDKQDQGRM